VQASQLFLAATFLLCLSFGYSKATTNLDAGSEVCATGDLACVMWVELRRTEGEVRFSLQVSDQAKFNVARKSYAGRVVIDIDGAMIAPDITTLPAGSGVVTGIRGANHTDSARIVLDVANPAAARQARVESDGGGWLRVILDESAADEMLNEPVPLEQSPPSVVDAQSAHEQAVALVRQDDLEGALESIAAARRSFPEAVGLMVDEIVMLNWAGRHEDALSHAEALAEASLPGFAYKALGRSARALGRYDTAEFWFRRAHRVEPEDAASVAGLSLSLADAGHAGEARQILRGAPEDIRQHAIFWMASAYVHETQGNHLAAVLDYDAALARKPGDESAQKAKSLALQALLQADNLTLN
jgi:thioredoxin-like negative regulator of GroEL